MLETMIEEKLKLKRSRFCRASLIHVFSWLRARLRLFPEPKIGSGSVILFFFHVGSALRGEKWLAHGLLAQGSARALPPFFSFRFRLRQMPFFFCVRKKCVYDKLLYDEFLYNSFFIVLLSFCNQKRLLLKRVRTKKRLCNFLQKLACFILIH